MFVCLFVCRCNAFLFAATGKLRDFAAINALIIGAKKPSWHRRVWPASETQIRARDANCARQGINSEKRAKTGSSDKSAREFCCLLRFAVCVAVLCKSKKNEIAKSNLIEFDSIEIRASKRASVH